MVVQNSFFEKDFFQSKIEKYFFEQLICFITVKSRFSSPENVRYFYSTWDGSAEASNNIGITFFLN